MEVELFVAVLGASNLTYAEATETQQLMDWVSSNVRALTYFGGVPRALVPDQLKSGVTGGRIRAGDPEDLCRFRGALRNGGLPCSAS